MPQSSVQQQAVKLWTEIWDLAGERWPPLDVPTAWRVYERVKQALVEEGVSEEQAIAFADDFFYRSDSWGDLTVIDNHKQVIGALTTALIDSELVAMENN